MTIAESQPPIDASVVEIPDQPEIPSNIETATGVTSVPTTPAPIQGPADQPVVQSVPAPAQNTPQVKIPAVDEKQLEEYSRGNKTDAKTWFGVFWIRKIKQAIGGGLSVIFGKTQ